MTSGHLASLAARVASREVRAVVLVAEALARIDRLDGPINAVTVVRGDEAMAEAERLDQALDAGAAPGPLCGLPLLVKDLEDVAGMVTTKGSQLLADAAPATADSRTTELYRAAGAIVVGKSNLPEFAVEGYTANLVFGTTRNPWAPEWSPGGSSGGSGAALAAGMVPLATATDGGGSVRIPAAFCGLVGLKPTRGLVGRRPVHDWLDLSTDGPMATSVADVTLLTSLLAGAEPGDPEALPYDAATALGPGRPITALLAAPRTADLGPLPAGVPSALHTAVDAFADLLRLPVRWLDPTQVFDEVNPDLDWFTLAAADHVAALGRQWVVDGLPRMHPATANFMRTGLTVGIDEYLAARRRRHDHVRRLDELLGESAVLLTPTVAMQGWLADGRLSPDGEPGALPAAALSTAMQNVTGHPALTVPAGRLANGVPFGLQLTGPRWSDGMLLAAARRWEEAHPWPLVAPGYEPFGPG